MGQLRIQELRQRAVSALGPQFNLKDFHEVVLRYVVILRHQGDIRMLRSRGPLYLLEEQVGKYIAGQIIK